MTPNQARTWLIRATLSVTAADLVFFLLAPRMGYPLPPDEAPRLLQIIVPVFTGYLGAAIHFLFGAAQPASVRKGRGVPSQMRMVVQGPVALFSVWVVAALIAFGWSNRVAAPQDTGMSVDELASHMTAALALLTATTGIVVNYLFGEAPRTKEA
jgi:hypothetical protein